MGILAEQKIYLSGYLRQQQFIVRNLNRHNGRLMGCLISDILSKIVYNSADIFFYLLFYPIFMNQIKFFFITFCLLEHPVCFFAIKIAYA